MNSSFACTANSEPYHLDQRGFFSPSQTVEHRDEEYPESGFQTLLHMQQEHFWYRGRHRFLLNALDDSLRRFRRRRNQLHAIDLGGGCGGWIKYLLDRPGARFAELALGDSSSQALEMAGPVVGPGVKRYQIDLLNLGWNERWDVAFMLDVLEHIPDDLEVLRQVRRSLKPGGLLFVACPALKVFWSYNDVLAQHCRRYSRADYRLLAEKAGFEMFRSRYFQFFLSPVYWLSRFRGPNPASLTPEQVRELTEGTHRIPRRPINAVLRFLFSAETPLGWRLPFPWGTSVLGVFRRSEREKSN
jgi:SAM-dependent methyltransferase